MREGGRLSRIITYAILIVITLATVYPILVVVNISLRPSDALYSTSLRLIPEGASLKAYRAVLFEKDFFISIDQQMSAARERFFRTVRGLYVPSSFISDVEPPSYHGMVITPEMALPIGFVARGRPTTRVPGIAKSPRGYWTARTTPSSGRSSQQRLGDPTALSGRRRPCYPRGPDSCPTAGSEG